GRDRRARQDARRADAAVLRHHTGLRQGASDGTRPAGHRRGVRRPGEAGARQARHAAQVAALTRPRRRAMTSTAAKTHQPRTEGRDGMRIDWDVEIRMDDGLVLRADVFRPAREGRYPVILTYGPYAKGLAFQDGYPSAWQRMAEKHPD